MLNQGEENKELYNYGSRIGWSYPESIFFNDIEFLGGKYLNYKIKKIKIWSGKKDSKITIKGIQVWYKNMISGELITPGKYKQSDDDDIAVEFEINSEEYLANFYIRVDTEVTQVGFETNKHNKILVGGTKGETKYVYTNGGDNIILFLYGSYAKDLDDLGIGYCNINLLKNLYFGFFQLKHKLKNNKVFKKH